jgi:hypothetical protein
MNKFYVRDGELIQTFDSKKEVVVFLEKAVVFKIGMGRKQWMEHMADLGYGPDEPTGQRFIESLQERHFEIGVVRNQKSVRCNIFEATSFNKPEYGN